jgi:hypothetical protein
VVKAPKPTLRAIEPRDYGHVEELRDAFFAGYGNPTQVRPFEGGPFTWMVAELEDRAVAVLSYVDTEPGQRWCWDLYRERGRWGTVGLFALVNWLEATSDAVGQELFFMTDMRNARHREAVENSQRGYGLVAHVFYRPRYGKS